jgi:DNA-directed RNA polymerase specialized sigma24 family protein
MPKSGDAILRAIRVLVEKGEYERYSDRDLLRRFAVGGDEAAFATLMRRHGPMVMGVARVLRHYQDAEDVCQATFLLLARKAKATTWRESIANWLYEAVYRLSLKTRQSDTRRSARERKVKGKAAPDALADITLRELQTILDKVTGTLAQKVPGAGDTLLPGRQESR